MQPWKIALVAIVLAGSAFFAVLALFLFS